MTILFVAAADLNSALVRRTCAFLDIWVSQLRCIYLLMFGRYVATYRCRYMSVYERLDVQDCVLIT